MLCKRCQKIAAAQQAALGDVCSCDDCLNSIKNSGNCQHDRPECSKGLANSRMVGGSKYKEMKMEPWDEMEATETKEDFLTYLRLAAKKHQLRLGRKEGSNILEDMEKAYHILEKWIEVYEND